MHSTTEDRGSSGVKDGQSSGHVVTSGDARGRGRVRLATFDDLEAIIDINDNIYDGLDYMPAYFYIYRHSKEYATYVYELDGILVALCCFYLLPDVDDLVCITALRVRPSFQGQGFGRPYKNPITDQFRRDHPTVTRYNLQTLYKPNIEAKMQEKKLLYRWSVLLYKLTKNERLERFPVQHLQANPRSRPIVLSYTQGTEWLKRSDELVKFLSKYPEDYIFARANWIPVRINATELRKLFSGSNVFVSFAERVDNSELLKTATADARNALTEEDEIVGFSISNVFQCKYGINFTMFYYGDSETDLLNHICSHLQHYVSVTYDDDVKLAARLHFPRSIDSNGVRERLREEFGEAHKSEYLTVTEAVAYNALFDSPL